MACPDTPSAAQCADTGLPAAAVLYEDDQEADSVLAEVARQLQAGGRRVRGLLMTYPAGRGDCRSPMVLVDIASGQGIQVSQPLGQDSKACRADPQGFARASEVLRRAQGESPELVIVNRFGGLEAEGRGFAAEFLALMSSGVPVLTSVARRHLAAWQTFTGGAPTLARDATAVLAWASEQLAT